MTVAELYELSSSTLPFELTSKQSMLLNALAAYSLNHAPNDIFLLNGYAGTGKTSVVGALIKGLKAAGKKTVLLAPTGRAAKVAAAYSDNPAFTIHKRIFRGNSSDPSNHNFFLAENRDADTLFIIDEASLISDSQEFFMSLLQQVLRHIHSAPGCGIILVGDIAQLPPVGMEKSPAMMPDRIIQLGYNPIQFTLDEPLRQAAQSGILFNATFIRHSLFTEKPLKKFGLIKKNFPDVSVIGSGEVGDFLSDSWGEVGSDETIIITRSNKRANQYNQAVRNMLLYAETPLERGDRIIISKNDYFWSKINKIPGFFANGETAEVTWIGSPEKKYGRWFVDVEMKVGEIPEPVGAKILLRSLATEGANIPREEMQRFYNLVTAEYEGEISHKIKGAMENPYYNALQVKYAYCVTCHKAQGGQWKHVYIDMGGLAIEPEDTQEFYRWLYTAVTRATEHVYFIDPSFKIA